VYFIYFSAIRFVLFAFVFGYELEALVSLGTLRNAWVMNVYYIPKMYKFYYLFCHSRSIF